MNTRRCGCWGLSPCLPIALVFLAVGCSQQESIRPEVVRPVKTQVVIAGGALHTRVFPGRVEASTRAELAFQVSGLLLSLPVKEGQNVAQGEVIAQLRQDEFQARLQTVQGQLDQARSALNALRQGERPEERLRREAQVRVAEARLANARADFERHARLIQSNAVPRAAYELAETTYRIAQEDHRAALQVLQQGTTARQEDIKAQEAQVRGLEGRLVEANLQLEDSTLRAPYDGVIARRFVDVGQNIRAQEPVVQFQEVEEVDIVHMNAEISGAPGLEFPVRIRETAQVADPITQTFQIRVAMKSPPGMNLLPGMTARVTLNYRRASILDSRILVPISAVFKDATGEQVAWVVGPDQTVSRRPVKIGEATGGQVEITEGLQPGDRIAVAGVTFLREGMQVRDLGDALGGGQS
jgi:multidrug efflux system membrane fusion protein